MEGSALTGHLLFVLSCLAQKAIPKDASDAGVAGVEAPAHTTLGVVGKVLGVVDPPGAIVIPQMVEGVFRGPDGKGRPVGGCCRCAPMDGIRCAHVGVMCGLSHQEPGQ